MRDLLTAADLAQHSGETVDRIEEWRSLGLIGRTGTRTFGVEDLHRTRLIQFLLRRGLPLEAIVEAEKVENLLARTVTFMFPGGAGPAYTLAEAAARAGLSADVARRFGDVFGLADQGDILDENDVRALETVKVAVDAGVPEEAMLQLVRVYADALERAAEAETRLFHFYVHERLKGEGTPGSPLAKIVQASAERVLPIVEPSILYFHRKGRQRAMREDAVLHVREYAGLWQKADVPGQLDAAIVFVDLAGFTSLADAMGDEMAARVVARFSEIVRDGVRRWDGRVVKQIGDAFMLAHSEPRAAVACAVEIGEIVAREPQFPAVRTGIHFGQVLYREGDYLGTGVNIAARVAAEAERRQIVVTSPVRNEIRGLDVQFAPLGKRRLRGLAGELELFAVVPRRAGDARVRRVDPVCGMDLASGEAAATLSLGGEERVFCSQQCLERFVAAPDRYGPSLLRS
jgi:adenylate cyclase